MTTYTVTEGVEATGSSNVTPPLPAGDLNGQLLLIVTGDSQSTAPTSAPAGYTEIGKNAVSANNRGPFVYAKFGTASESPPTVSYSTAGCAAYMLAIASDGGWPATIGEAVEAVSNGEYTTNSSSLWGPPHTVAANENCAIQFCCTVGGFSGNSSAAPTPEVGYEQAGFASRELAAGVYLYGHRLSGSTSVGSNLSENILNLPGNSTSGRKGGVTIEFHGLAPVSGPVITDTVPATPYPGQTGVLINGSGFGATQGASTVTYGGLACTVTAWSDTQITVNWPNVSAPGSTLAFNANHTLEVNVV